MWSIFPRIATYWIANSLGKPETHSEPVRKKIELAENQVLSDLSIDVDGQ